MILCFMLVGAYSIDNNVFGIVVMIIFGIIGFFCKKLDLPMTPLVLTFVLGPLMERSLRQSLEMSRGNLSILVTRPLSVMLLVVAVLIIVSSALKLMPAGVETVRSGDGDI
jgi:putative tricarboxylic transport membrane protein